MKISLLLLAASVAFLCRSQSVQAQVYQLDDGTAEQSYGFGNGTVNSGAIYLDEFPVIAGANSITSISIAWGSPGHSGQDVNGRSMVALLYNDPNGDGSPLDSTLVGSISGTIQSVATNTFITYTLPSAVTIGTTNFFVGFYVPGFTATEGSEQGFAGLNTSTGNLPSRSFTYANSDGSNPSLTNLASDTYGGSNATLGIPGNWLVRANAVPESSTWALLSAGIGGGLLLARYRSQRV